MKVLMEMENSGFIALIEGGKYEDLGRMYVLFKRVPGGLDLLRGTMGDYIRSTGRALVQVHLAATLSSAKLQSTQDMTHAEVGPATLRHGVVPIRHLCVTSCMCWRRTRRR